MKANTDKVLGWLALTEGGYVDHPNDPGGPTNMGVTQRVYDGWRKSRGELIQSVKNIHHHEASKIFRDQYFVPVRFDDLPPGLDYTMADFSVNSGPGRAVKTLQQALVAAGHKIAIDGHMGVATLGAVQQTTPASQLVRDVNDRRMVFLKRLKNWPSFKNGWTSRVKIVKSRSLDMALGQVVLIHSIQKPTAGKATGAPSLLAMLINILKAIFGGKA